MTLGTHARGLLLLGFFVACLAPLDAGAQGRGRGGGGGDLSFAPMPSTRLTLLTDAFPLDKTQKEQVKNLMDAAYKEAAPLRADLVKARVALGAAVTTGAADAAMAPLLKTYGAAAAAMTSLEMKTAAQILQVATAAQRPAGAVTTFFLLRGALAGEKKWDEVPDGRAY